MRSLMRLMLPTSGLILAMAVVVQSGTLDSRLPAWATELRPGAKDSAVKPEATVKPPRVIAEGLVVPYPGAEVIVGTEAAGRIVLLEVQEKSTLRKGELIAELNAEDLKADRAAAIARMQEAEADIQFFGREYRREESLIARRAGTSQHLDESRRGLETAQARRSAAMAERDRINALLDKTRILAPIDGVITARYVHPGETLEVAARVVTIADLNRIRIEAEVDEFDTGRVTLGAPVKITAEGYPGVSWKGTVEEIPDSVVSRRIRPEDPGRPIDARVLPVKITFDETTPLKLGHRVEIEILAQANH